MELDLIKPMDEWETQHFKFRLIKAKDVYHVEWYSVAEDKWRRAADSPGRAILERMANLAEINQIFRATVERTAASDAKDVF